MAEVMELKNPLVQHHLAALRNRDTPPHIFREQIRHLSLFLAYEAAALLPLRTVTVETPLQTAECLTLKGRLGLVPILRAGLGMSGAIQEAIPHAEIWHLGFYRDESTLEPVEYYGKFSDSPPDFAFIVDPMLATGGSACVGIDRVKRWGVPRIILLCIIAAPEGISKVTRTHTDVDVFTCAIDERLDKNAYILPGLGDAGDRIFNTI